MYKVLKVINNNALLAYDLHAEKEVIFLATGVGFGKKLNTFLIPSTRYPAKNPANKAPKNPPLTTDILESNALAMVIPEFANAPPTKPAANPGLSAILIDIYPAKTGNIKLNDVSPIVLRTADNGVFFPKLAGFIL